MGVPGHDERDWNFAHHFKLPVISILKDIDVSEKPYEEKNGTLANSDFLNGLSVADAIKKIIDEIEKKGIGQRKVNYKQRDAVFGRQRYWGEPIPMYYKNGIPYPVDEADLPIILPEVDKFLPTEDGEPPLARAKGWKYKGQYEFETTTMPGWAGSSWYYLRYMSPGDDKEFVAKEALEYWKQIDLYVGGAEHATGHLLYFRFWTKFLKDREWVPFEEPAKKLVNQGMIQGVSAYVYVYNFTQAKQIRGEGSHIFQLNIYIPLNIYEKLNRQDEKTKQRLTNHINEYFKNNFPEKYNEIDEGLSLSSEIFFRKLLVPIEYVNENNELQTKSYHIYNINSGYELSFFKDENDKFITERAVEKMSKSKFNVINPDEVIQKYGADCFRIYEMFLGPIEASKPWDTKGIDGVSRFLRKFWRLFYDDDNSYVVTDEKATDAELKILHKTIKKVAGDMENLSFNTSVSAFMICLNELTALNCHKKEVLEKLLVILCPFAPHICEYLWQKTGHEDSVVKATFPEYDEKLLEENTVTYPVAINGKVRDNIVLPTDASDEQIKSQIMELEGVKKWLDGKPPKKVIVVKGKMVNVVV